MTIITLEELEFFSYHGCYEEERRIGNRYSVSIALGIAQIDFTSADLSQTVDYGEVYRMIDQVMSSSHKLLETLASIINQKLLSQFEVLVFVETTISKHNPPIKGIAKKATVSIKQER